MKPRILFIAILLSLHLFSIPASAQGLKKRMNKTFTEYLSNIASDSTALKLRSDLKDSVDSWIEMKLDYTMFLASTHWKVDSAVFFDKSRTKALLILLFQPDDPDYKFDYSKYIAAEKLGDRWQFYYVSLPLQLHDRKNGQRVPFEELAKESRFQIWSDGFIYCTPVCHINYKYVASDVWFTQWRRDQHEKFLANTLPKLSFRDITKEPH